MNNVGLSIMEGVANGNSAFRNPSKRNIGLLMQSTRGVPFVPTKIQSLEDFNVIFGGSNSNFFGPAIIKSIFDEAGAANVTLYLARVLGSDYVTASKAVVFGTVEGTVKASYKGQEDPGAWGNSLKVILYSYGYKTKDSFLMQVFYKDVLVESYSYPTLAQIQNSVNQVSKYVQIDLDGELAVTHTDLTGTLTTTLTSATVTGVGTSFTTEVNVGDVLYSGSSLIGTVEKIISATSLTLNNKAIAAVAGAAAKVRNDVTVTLSLQDGDDGTVVEADFYPGGTTEAPTGLACFNGVDVQLLACTEFHTLSMAKKLNTYVNEVQKPIGLVNLPVTADVGTAELYALELQTPNKSFLSGLLGWVKVSDESGNNMLIPGLGIWLGAGFLRTPYLNGDFIHIPPAGLDSLFNSVIDTLPKRLSQPNIDKIVRDFTCNVIQYIENVGFYIASSRTYSTDPMYMSLHIRQQTSFYKETLLSSMRYMEQKPNTPELRREALIDLRTFFKKEYDNGALERSVPFEKAYQGICDRSNNPTTQDRKTVNIDVLWIPTECVESVNLSLKRNDGVLTVTE